MHLTSDKISKKLAKDLAAEREATFPPARKNSFMEKLTESALKQRDLPSLEG